MKPNSGRLPIDTDSQLTSDVILQKLEGYRLLERIGRGGQAVIWSAFDESRKQVVAVKIGSFDPGNEQADAYIFAEQSAMVAGLDHPGILPLLGFGSEGAYYYSITPYVPGGSLYDQLGVQKLDTNRFLNLAAQILNILAFVHHHGVVHRDLKTANVLADYADRAYLMDFGLARQFTVSTMPLHTGRGTPPYAPPEQLAMKGMTPRSDIFSLGVMLYEMATGILPWNGERALGAEQLTADLRLPDPREINPLIPAELVRLLRAMTAADPAERPPSVAEVSKVFFQIYRDQRPDLSQSVEEAEQRNAAALLRRLDATQDRLSLTDFTLINTIDARLNERGKPAIQDPDQTQTMLHYACHYGVRAAHWWEMVQEPSRRREVIETLLDDESVKGVHTALNCALRDKSWGGQGDAVAPALLRGLLQFAAERDPDQLLPAALQFIKAVLPGESGWQSHALGPLEDIQLAELALTDQPYARDALSLIAHTRSRAAIDVLAAEIPSRRATAALSEVRSRTGALPSSIPASVRWKILREITRKQITADRSTLSAALILTALGGIIGFGLYVFITYRLPTFLDLQRILVSVERSLILGGGVGLGLFTARWLGARLRVVSIPVRLSLGTVGAAILIALAELIYYPVMLNRPVDGGLLWVGVLILGLAFGAAGVVGKRIVSGVIVFLSLIGVILSSWLAALTSGETPLLAFETSWSLLQVGMLALLVSFPLAVLGNVVDLRVKGESRSTGGAGPGG